jgi:hypothetical protein
MIEASGLDSGSSRRRNFKEHHIVDRLMKQLAIFSSQFSNVWQKAFNASKPS